jgi:hypothetical protein
MATPKHRELLEAQLITSCLEAATDKLHVLALIRDDGDQNSLLKMRSDETGRLLEQHSVLTAQLKDNIDTRRSLSGGRGSRCPQAHRRVAHSVGVVRLVLTIVCWHLSDLHELQVTRSGAGDEGGAAGERRQAPRNCEQPCTRHQVAYSQLARECESD